MALFITIIGLYLAVGIVVLLSCLKGISNHKRINGRVSKIVFSTAFILIAATPFIGSLFRDAVTVRILYRTVNMWLGFGVYMLMGVVLLKLSLLILTGLNKRLKDRFWEKFLVITLVCVGFMIFGNIHYKHVKKVEYNVHAAKDSAPKSADGKTEKLKIAFVADLHLGAQIGTEQMQKMVDAVNEMNPDIVLMGGDIFDSNYDMLKNPDEVIAVLRKIRSRYGTYGVYGNHDIKEKLIGGFSTNPDGKAFRDPRMASFLEKSGVRMLDDETVRFRGGEVVLAGRFDGMKIGTHLTRRKSAKELLSEVDPKSTVIVMEHEPVEFDELEKLGVKLVLSGHTHAGQFFPFNLPQSLIWDNAYGLKKFGNAYSVVTSGVGLYGPALRIGTDSEVVEINFSYKAYKKRVRK